MKINFRHYTNELTFNDDFFKVFHFLKKHGAKGVNENWHWGRWEWLIGHPNLEEGMLPIIGVWEYGEDVVGIATHDMRIGKAYIVCDPEFKHLKHEMLKYAESNLSFNDILKIASNSIDFELLEFLEKKQL